jgi:histidine triad (HIT) family protein
MEKPCVFCAIIRGQEPAAMVYRDARIASFLDRRPLFPGHVLVVPTAHVVTLPDLEPAELDPLFGHVRALCAALPHALGADGSFVALNNVVSQSVPHLHVHVVPRKKGDGLRGFFWPRQKYGDDREMAETAQRIAAAL